MPELPDVEVFRRVLASRATGRVVRRVEVRDAGVLHRVSARGLRGALEGRRFTRAERHGEWLLARTGGPTVLLHFGMTGMLLCGRPDGPADPHDRVLFTVPPLRHPPAPHPRRRPRHGVVPALPAVRRRG